MNTTFDITESAAKRVAVLLGEERQQRPGVRLRVSVLGGGCSGFQYNFEFDDTKTDTDLLIERDGASVVIDDVSLGFLQGSVLDYVETLGEASFQIKNPNATAKCGCGNSFAV
jgi:iron-sulfur cluster insertion protein